jgi:hypothetical protein
MPPSGVPCQQEILIHIRPLLSLYFTLQMRAVVAANRQHYWLICLLKHFGDSRAWSQKGSHPCNNHDTTLCYYLAFRSHFSFSELLCTCWFLLCKYLVNYAQRLQDLYSAWFVDALNAYTNHNSDFGFIA